MSAVLLLFLAGWATKNTLPLCTIFFYSFLEKLFQNTAARLFKEMTWLWQKGSFFTTSKILYLCTAWNWQSLCPRSLYSILSFPGFGSTQNLYGAWNISSKSFYKIYRISSSYTHPRYSYGILNMDCFLHTMKSWRWISLAQRKCRNLGQQYWSCFNLSNQTWHLCIVNRTVHPDPSQTTSQMYWFSCGHYCYQKIKDLQKLNFTGGKYSFCILKTYLMLFVAFYLVYEIIQTNPLIL